MGSCLSAVNIRLKPRSLTVKWYQYKQIISHGTKTTEIKVHWQEHKQWSLKSWLLYVFMSFCCTFAINNKEFIFVLMEMWKEDYCT